VIRIILNERDRVFGQQAIDEMVSAKVRLLRAEACLTQERMAAMIGISKKTLVQAEKGRQTLGFCCASLTAILFRGSDTIHSLFGDLALEIVAWAAGSPPTAGGKAEDEKNLWIEEARQGAYQLQKHVLTGHYLIIDTDRFVRFYSLDRQDALNRMGELEPVFLTLGTQRDVNRSTSTYNGKGAAAMPPVS
jgi:DNA-binding XRE family transcriptional regulator